MEPKIQIVFLLLDRLGSYFDVAMLQQILAQYGGDECDDADMPAAFEQLHIVEEDDGGHAHFVHK